MVFKLHKFLKAAPRRKPLLVHREELEVRWAGFAERRLVLLCEHSGPDNWEEFKQEYVSIKPQVDKAAILKAIYLPHAPCEFVCILCLH